MHPPIIKTIAFSKGTKELIIWICLGEAVFPIMTIIEIIMLGIITSLNFHKEIAARITKTDSSIIALTKNCGSPIGIPIMPTILIETKIAKTIF